MTIDYYIDESAIGSIYTTSPIYSELQFSQIANVTDDDLTQAENEINGKNRRVLLVNESASWQDRLRQWDHEAVEEACLAIIDSGDFNQQVDQLLMQNEMDIHDADVHREAAKEEADALLYQQHYQLTRQFLADHGQLVNDFNQPSEGSKND